ncbi:thioredoxin domain-containing protein [Sphingobacterium paramultivorum]|uniref:Thioredoxin domain-containing protein n=1 Tax=Sphingobacterium paramultivorum TaxID=2886510 RepID=A0A7G5E1W7_9SPHI|nr:thioredoxin domain-containing protein [Sphingobacterium paramultivorum]QMV67992.1 thioredoxin domain-containing protein [Sphingobacterium paramultivorum]WSO16892.1 thioredoxin domain-containing protein [Sphingobacterium paramultivorum]
MSLKIPVSITDHAQGNLDADLVIVEYGDYQCPYCGAAYPVLKKLLKKFSGEVKFVFRNFPLSEMHEYALPAAIAAEAAFLQDKFWEMHDAIYENQRKLDDQYLFKIAEKIGLDMEKFKSDIQKEELVNKIDADFQGGVISGVNGTPSFYVNGKKFNGAAEDLFELFTRSTGEI